MKYNISELEKEYKVKLDDAQIQVLSDLTSFITSNEHCICLTGCAGTSKSMIASMLYDILADNGY
jgi:alpha-D-ribose 1-methylphosphonate 5-triphosphate synthase subunit PhnL